jgi:hypothetical protein
MADSEELGAGTGRQGPWAHDEDDRAEGTRLPAAKEPVSPGPTARDTEVKIPPERARPSPKGLLDVEGDPRGGVQSDDYRHADATDIVEEGGTAMSGPGGAPQDDRSIEERREESADTRDAAVSNPSPPRD